LFSVVGILPRMPAPREKRQPGPQPDEDASAAILEESVPPDVKADANAIFGEMAADHPRDPHWYLPTVGIEPDLHRKGLGSALLTEGLIQCDQEHMPAYLESSNSATAALYQRLGLKALDVIYAGGIVRENGLPVRRGSA